MATKPYRSKAKINVAKIRAQAEKAQPQPTDEERKKSDEVEMMARADRVLGLYLSGSRRSEIVQYGSNLWHVTERQVDDYIARAKEIIKAEFSKDHDENLAEHIAFRRKLRKMAESDKDWRAALASAQDEAKLLDLYPVEKHQVSVEEKTLIAVDR